LVVDQQPDDLAVRDVDHRLARLRVAVTGLGVRQRSQLVEGVEVGAGQPERLAFVQVAAQADVPVRQGEDRLRLREDVEVELRLADRPGLDREGGVGDHRSRSSARSGTTTSAPCSSSAFAWPTRSTPTTNPKRPALPALTPASASSNTAAAFGSTASAFAAARNVSGAGLPFRCSRAATTPSTRTSKSSSIPADRSTSCVFALAETTAVCRPASRAAFT